MIKTLTAYTLEVDDPEQAVKEILEQLDLDKTLLTNSVGIVTCYADFLHTGVVKALCDRLPFEVVGVTTLGAATEQAADTVILTLAVLTSDEISFAAGLTDSLAETQEKPIRDAVSQAMNRLPDKPSLGLLYVPMLAHVGGEKLVRITSQVTGEVPLFGTLTCDHNFDFHDSHTIYNGQHYRDRMAMVFMSGPVRFKFMTISIPEDNIRKESAVITESEGNVVKRVNDAPVLDYLKSIGLSPQDGLEGSKYIPIILNYNDGTPPVARCFYMITPEGFAACGGDMPVNATLALGHMEYDDVIRSADQLLTKIGDPAQYSGMLMISCIVRSVTLGIDQMAEARNILASMRNNTPYQLCYSGGEICPVYKENGLTANRFHNFSFAVCLFVR